jgi:ATP-dependent Clp protease ATP-binding subunit ClpC
MNDYPFTDHVRMALGLAREQAGRLGHDYVSPDHILLGILAEGHGVAAAAIAGLGVEPLALGRALEARMERGKQVNSDLDLPYTSSAKRVLELAMVEARELRHTFVGTEHLLLGVLREGRNWAAAVLLEHGLPAGRLRGEILRLLGSGIPAGPTAAAWVGPVLPHETPATGRVSQWALLLSIVALLVAVAALVVK